MDRRDRAARALVAVVAALGVALQFVLSIELARSNGRSVVDGLVAYFGYFTVLTNIFVGFVLASTLVHDPGPIPRWFARATVLGCATTSIAVVGLTYHLVLRQLWAPQGLQWLADMLLHYVVPIGTVLVWAMLRMPRTLPWWAPLAWCVYPLGYLVYALLRGALIGSYPYPFIDVTTIGYARTFGNALGMLVGFVVLGYLMLAIARIADRR